jgi:hypothetical protein
VLVGLSPDLAIYVVYWGLLRMKSLLYILLILMFQPQKGFSWSFGCCNSFDSPRWHEINPTDPTMKDLKVPFPHWHRNLWQVEGMSLKKIECIIFTDLGQYPTMWNRCLLNHCLKFCQTLMKKRALRKVAWLAHWFV